MPKTKEWRNPNKQLLVTGHKKFDAQLTAISPGQVLGGTQTAMSIRPRSETIGPVGQKCDPGYLRRFDLQHFPDMPYEVRAYVESATTHHKLMVHEFFTHRSGRKIIIGYLLVRYGIEGDGSRILAGFCTTRRASGYRVLDAVAPYVADMEEGEAVPYIYGRR